MMCLICRQAEILHGLMSVKFERSEIRFVVNSVPAYICPGCGEAYLDEYVAVRLLRDAEEMACTGMLEGVIEYDNFT